jgi:hypothetical protein
MTLILISLNCINYVETHNVCFKLLLNTFIKIIDPQTRKCEYINKSLIIENIFLVSLYVCNYVIMQWLKTRLNQRLLELKIFCIINFQASSLLFGRRALKYLNYSGIFLISRGWNFARAKMRANVYFWMISYNMVLFRWGLISRKCRS